MKEKILTVLVIISLALSVFSLVLTLRATPNIITTVTTDTETLRADSLELEIKDFSEYSSYGQYQNPSIEFIRIDNETLITEIKNSLSKLNATLVNADFFYNNVIQGKQGHFTGVLRCHNTFYCTTDSNGVFCCTP
jgi:hypothetical protein